MKITVQRDVSEEASMKSHTKDVDSLCWDPTSEYVVSVSEDTVKSPGSGHV